MPNPVPSEITRLVARFAEHRAEYQSARYNETQLRREFVDPFFVALGWDVDNSRENKLAAFKDVIHEDSVVVEGSAKAPDYGFRAGGVRKFFVETKRPSVNLRIAAEPAYQLRRYAWSAKLPVSVLTDFQEFAVYDTRVQPTTADGAAVARIEYIGFEEYESKWDVIASLFSRDAVYSGSIDRFAQSARRLRGTLEVDDAFLTEIESWREVLAHNLALRNTLSSDELNFSVQATIDRIIFLRICEDRGLEEAGRLRELVADAGIYARLLAKFREADAKYNSGLFHFDTDGSRAEPPDQLTPRLVIDDSILKRVIKSLYYPSPYDFRVFPPDVLGHVYERFLGKVVRVTESGHRATIEQKPEVRKAGGVFYTPTHIDLPVNS